MKNTTTLKIYQELKLFVSQIGVGKQLNQLWTLLQHMSIIPAVCMTRNKLS